MEPGCEFGPDCPNMVKDLCKIVGSKAKTIVCKWSVTQSLSFKQQLDAGIRFFDLRVATNDASGPLDKVCFSHGLLCCTVEPCLREIAVFLNDHPKEVVLLDFSHFYKMSEALHNQLFQLLSSVFNGKLCPFVLNGEVQANVDLNTMWARRHQVIVFYQCKFASQHPELWPAPTIGTAWANTCDPNKLMSFLEQTYLRRQAGATTHIFYGFQGVLTPDFSFIMTHVIGNLKDTFAAEVSRICVSNNRVITLQQKCVTPAGCCAL